MAQDAVTAASVARGDRSPPYSEEAERGVLGSILLDAARVMDLCIQGQLVAESFYLPIHRIIYAALLEMQQHDKTIDLVTVTDKLRASGDLERIGGPIALDRLVDATPTAAHAEYYIDIVRQKHLLRSVIDRAREAEALCYGTEESATSVLSRVEQWFFDITADQHGAMRPWPTVVNDVIRHIEVIATTRKVAGLSTGFRNLDQVLMGMRPGNLIILAARPSMGKTSLAINIAENVAQGFSDAEGRSRPVGIFSLEMSCDDLVTRMMCSRAQVSAHKIAGGYVSDVDWRKLVNAADQLTRAPIFLDDAAGLDIMELRARARRMKKKHDIQFIIVDYLQLLHSREDAKQGRQIEIASVSGHLKAMAKELRIPVMVVSQLSRAPEIRDKHAKPKLSDLRDSGAIEQDADVVLLLRRPCRIPEDEQHGDALLAIVDVAKHRNGPTHEGIQFNFIDEFTLFQDRDSRVGVDALGAAEEGEGTE
jgi:replicative DNA helicase